MSGTPVMVPDTAPEAFTSTRLLLSSSVSAFALLLVDELGLYRGLLKKACVLKVMLPPLPSPAKDRISLSSRAMIVLASIVISPPPSPLKTLVAISLSPSKRMSLAVMLIDPIN